MKRDIIFIITLALIILNISKVNAQDVPDGVYLKQHVPARQPIPYHHLREADVMWSKKIWRMINLREKINHPLYYPTKRMDDRMSLTDLLIWGVENENLTVYSTDDDEFKSPITIKEINVAMGAVADTSWVPDVETGEMIQKIIQGEREPSDVKEYMVKEVWFFDKQRAKMEVRIVGLCPIRHYFRDDDLEQTDLKRQKVAWIYFPAVRNILANHEVFNPNNDAERKTFDDIFFKRKFNSYVSQETNVYDNRSINEYKMGLDAQLEAEKVKEIIFNVEHDLWSY